MWDVVVAAILAGQPEDPRVHSWQWKLANRIEDFGEWVSHELNQLGDWIRASKSR